MKYSFGILKPDCVRRDLIDQAFEVVRARGLKVIFSKKIRLTSESAQFLYNRCRESNFFENLIYFMTSGDVVVYVVEALNGECAIKTLNSATGHTNPAQAKPNTLRSLGFDVCENIAHSTTDEQTFWLEVNHFLNEQERLDLKLEPE